MLACQQRAYDYFTQAANAGNTHAMAFLGKVSVSLLTCGNGGGSSFIYLEWNSSFVHWHFMYKNKYFSIFKQFVFCPSVSHLSLRFAFPKLLEQCSQGKSRLLFQPPVSSTRDIKDKLALWNTEEIPSHIHWYWFSSEVSLFYELVRIIISNIYHAVGCRKKPLKIKRRREVYMFLKITRPLSTRQRCASVTERSGWTCKLSGVGKKTPWLVCISLNQSQSL